MTKEEFEVLQSDLQRSGKSLKNYLHDVGISYSTYNYWRKKLDGAAHSTTPSLAPIRFSHSPERSYTGAVPSGATLLFPNGLRAHFGAGTEDVLRDLLNLSLCGHVLP